MIAYMLTWTTYGTWLQSDDRDYRKDGKTRRPNPALYNTNCNALKQKVVYLSNKQRDTAKRAIFEKADRMGQRVYALTVQHDHVHLVLEKNDVTVESAIHRYKRVATYVLRKAGMAGKIWTKGYDSGYCFTQVQLDRRVEYVLRHDVEIVDRPPQRGCRG